MFMPKPVQFEPDEITQDVLKLVGDKFSDHFGDLEPFWFAVTHEQAAEVLDYFLEAALPSFGDYQDAMLTGQKFLYHSLLSPYINCGLLDPLAVCKRVEAEYKKGRVPLNATEGFIRQIIGWREYVRGIYWLKMPEYVKRNFLEADNKLPDFYWTGETEMLCLREAITQTKEEAYAHHIQRLMVTGNFAMLAGVDPHEVHEWYLAVYADAYEWVELPNTLGMSQFGDGGILGSKPYAASGNYINKMSDYCKNCHYNVKLKTGSDACPFNALYWDFLIRNEDKLKGNPRLGQVYRTWNKMDAAKRDDYLASFYKFVRFFKHQTPAFTGHFMLRFLILALFITLSTSPSSAFTLKQQISKGTFEYQGVKINPKPLEEIYKSNKYKGLWTSKKGLFGLKRGLTKDGKLLVKTLSSAADEGLNPNRYLANANIDKKQMKGKKIDQLELYLTAEFLKFARDIHIGIVDQSRLQADIFKTKKSFDPIVTMKQLKKQGLKKTLASLRPQHPYIYKKNKIVDQRRIIIGKTEHASPQFSDRMTYVEFNPQWNVPQSIAVNEYVPKLLKNSKLIVKILRSFLIVSSRVKAHEMHWVR